MATMRISYARGFPYGAPLAMIRGGATKDDAVKSFLREQGFTWDGSRYAWSHYLDRTDFGPILKSLRDDFDCEVVPKQGMDENYIINLDDPKFGRPEQQHASVYRGRGPDKLWHCVCGEKFQNLGEFYIHIGRPE